MSESIGPELPALHSSRSNSSDHRPVVDSNVTLRNVSPQESDRGSTHQTATQPEVGARSDRESGDSHDVEKGLDMGDESRGNSQKPDPEKADESLVVWNGPDDPENPQNWPLRKKILSTSLFSFMTMCITFASTVFSEATAVTAKKFGVGEEVTTLGTSLFVLGFVFGPLLWGPMSEVYGRKIPLFAAFATFCIFQIPVAVAQNLYTILICRFFAGLFGCAPLVVIGGALADVWSPTGRGLALAVWTLATFIGPIAGPIAGGFVVESSLGWRWTAWFTLFLSAPIGLVAFFAIPESYAPVLLQRRATKLRYSTRNWALHSDHDTHQVRVSDIITIYIQRPLKMLVLEPILLSVTIYMSLIYGILYLFFEAYPVSFHEKRGWSNAGVAALPFIALGLGVFFGVTTVAIMTKTGYVRKLKERGYPLPEDRLPPMIVGGFILPAGLFWFGWTSSPNITWVPQVLAGIPIGMGLMMIFIQGIAYIVDVYTVKASSALAANTFMRSLAGAGFPLFAVQMYHKLGVPWATSLLAFLCALMVPVPFVFYIYGKRIRELSKFIQ